MTVLPSGFSRAVDSPCAVDYMLNAKVGYNIFAGWEILNLKVDETGIKGIEKLI